MKHFSHKAFSFTEVIVLTLLIVAWVVSVYKVYHISLKSSSYIQNKIIATQIAREWIEGVLNIRDTNYKLFALNTANCWMTSNYNSNCITSGTEYFQTGSYILIQDGNFRWTLEQKSSPFTTGNYMSPAYRNTYAVKIGTGGLFSQGTGGILTGTWQIPFFTREIRLHPLGSPPPQKYKVESIVQWRDIAIQTYHEVVLSTEITNWKP